MTGLSSKSQDQLAVLHPFPKLVDDTRRTRPEKLETIIANLEAYHVETKKTILAQAIIDKTSSMIHESDSSANASSDNTNHIPESNVVASHLRTRWEPGSAKPTIKTAIDSRLLPSMPPSGPKLLAERTVERLDACDKISASALDKFYKSKERARHDSTQASTGFSGDVPAAGIGDPRLVGRAVEYDPSRDPRLRR